MKFSFECFPPKNESSFQKLKTTLRLLAEFHPEFISLTYGSSQSQYPYFEILDYIQNKLHINAVPHFTALPNSKESTKLFLKRLQSIGIKNILSLRGDIPKNPQKLSTQQDFHFASDLITFIHQQTPSFKLFIAGYPEGHYQSTDMETDMRHLINKINEGGSVIITQLFFENQFFFEFYKRLSQKKINCPILPGILPVTSSPSFQKILDLAKPYIPHQLKELLKQNAENPSEKLLNDFTLKQCLELNSHGVDHFHFYTLNSYETIQFICSRLKPTSNGHLS